MAAFHTELSLELKVSRFCVIDNSAGRHLVRAYFVIGVCRFIRAAGLEMLPLLKPGSIQHRWNAIAEAHKTVGVESPTHHATVTNTMKGIRRTLGTAPAQKAAALTDDIRAMVGSTDVGIIGARPGASAARIRGRVPPVGVDRAGR
jgi:hypothetical protein